MQNITEVSTTVPGNLDIITTNNVSLKQHEMLTNARYIHNTLKSGWKFYAICAMLGNMEHESTINPDRWQNGTVNTSLGYGLVQWTPSTKYTSWLTGGADKKDINKQLERIQYEVDTNNDQWNKSLHSPQITFSGFTQSTQTVNVLAEYFLRCYERCTITSEKISERQFSATKWSTLIGYLI